MNTSPVVLFDFEDHYVRTIIDDRGEPWFVATDVCSILDIQNVTDAIKPLGEDERSRKNLGRQGEANLISESGLYRFIFRSKKPEAENFRLWVFREVLHAIRKTGTYTRPNVPVPIVSESEWPLALAQTREGERMVREMETGMKVAKMIGLRNRRRMLEQANDIVMLRTGIDCLAYFGIDLDVHYLPARSVDDTIDRFLAECCVDEERERTRASVLYAAFRNWHEECIEGGVTPSIKVFSAIVKARYRKIKNDTIWYCGLRLLEKEVAL